MEGSTATAEASTELEAPLLVLEAPSLKLVASLLEPSAPSIETKGRAHGTGSSTSSMEVQDLHWSWRILRWSFPRLEGSHTDAEGLLLWKWRLHVGTHDVYMYISLYLK